MEALHYSGLTVRGKEFSNIIVPADYLKTHATDDARKLPKMDLVITSVKTKDLVFSTKAFIPLITNDTVILTTQNGVTAHEVVKSEITATDPSLTPCILPGAVSIYCLVDSPGKILYRGAGFIPDIAFGSIEPKNRHISEQVFNTYFSISNPWYTGNPTERVLDLLWRKLMVVSIQGVVGSLTRLTLQGYWQVEETKQLIRDLLYELTLVAKAEGINLTEQDVTNMMMTYEFFVTNSSSTTTSLQRDVVAGNRSEIEAQVGVVVKKGKQHGIKTTHWFVVYALLLAIEMKAEGRLTEAQAKL